MRTHFKPTRPLSPLVEALRNVGLAIAIGVAGALALVGWWSGS